MSHITLSEEQSKLIIESAAPIEVRSPDGVLLGLLQPSDDARLIAQAMKNRASGRPGIPSHKVQALLQELDKADENGATDDELRELSKRLLAEVRK